MPQVPEIRAVWFLPNTRDLLDVSAIKLGSIVESPWKPEEVFNEDDPPTITSKLISSREEMAWSWTREVERSAGGGLFASFLQFLGIGGEIGSTVDKKHADIFTVDRMVTDEFSPDKNYLEQCIQDPGVRDEFIGPSRRSKAYMVTGLKTAYGATKATEIVRKKSSKARVGIDATAVAMPFSLGSEIHRDFGVTEKSGADKSDFVFAFKLRRLRYTKGELTHKLYTQGAQYNKTGQGSNTKNGLKELDAKDFEVEDLEDAAPKEFGMESRDIISSSDGEGVVRICYTASL